MRAVRRATEDHLLSFPHMFAAALLRAPLHRAPLRILSPAATEHRLLSRAPRSLSTPRTLTERRPLRQNPDFIDFHARIRSSLTTLLTTLTTLEVDEAPASDR